MPQDNVDEIIQAMGIDQSKTMSDYGEDSEIPKLWGKYKLTEIKIRL